MLYTSLETALFDYVTDGWQNAWDKLYETYREQARALFTAYCIMYDIYDGTGACSSLMYELYEKVSEGVEFEDFDNYMVELIV